MKKDTNKSPTAAGPRRVDDASPKPVLRHLLPYLAVMVILLLAGAMTFLWQEHRQRLAGEMAAEIADISGDLHMVLDQQAAGLAMAAQPIAADTTVQKALREADADRLLAAWRPVFETLHRENHLTHFYFFDTNRVCLLRVHKPDKRGDLINRLTAIEAERTGKTASGIELGPLGTFTLRVVQPVFAGGALAGYVELGKEIEDLLQALHTWSCNQLAVIIRKKHLNRQTWEEGMRLLGREADWDRLPHSVVIYASQGRLPDAFAPMADHDTTGNYAYGETDREIACDGKDWRVAAIPMKDASGAEVGDLLVMCDITARKAVFARLLALGGMPSALLLALLIGLIYVLLRRTDAGIRAQQVALRVSEERYRRLFESSHDAIMTLEPPSWKFTTGNPTAIEMFKAKNEEEFVACEPWKLSPARQPDGRASDEKAKEMIATAMRAGAHFFEWTHKRIGGEEFPATVLLSRLAHDNFMFLQATVRDITEHKRAEDRLSKINTCFLKQGSDTNANINRLVALCGELLGGTCALYNRLEGNLLCSVGQWHTPADYNPKDKPEGHVCYDMIRQNPGGVLVIRNLASSAYARTDPNVVRHRLQTYIGKTVKCGERPVGALCVVYQKDFAPTEDDQKLLGIIASAVGVEEERKQAEEKIHNLNESLERRVQERTAELARANQELETLIRIVTHDLRSPLVNIQGFGQILNKTCSELAGILTAAPLLDETRQAFAAAHEKIGKSMRFINTSVDKMNGLINGLLHLSRLGHATLVNQPVDMDVLIKTVLEAVTFQLRTAAAEVKVDALPACQGDATLINQVFSNLLDNAIKYRDSARPLRVRVWGRREGAHAVYCIEDNGLGVAPEHQQRIWNMFYRLDPQGKVTGDGLGLSAVQRIVERHGGKIWMESEVGQGSRFFLSLNAAVEEEKEP